MEDNKYEEVIARYSFEQLVYEQAILNEEETTLYDQIVTDLEGYSDEELADILSSVGVSPKGKRQALLAKIVSSSIISFNHEFRIAHYVRIPYQLNYISCTCTMTPQPALTCLFTFFRVFLA